MFGPSSIICICFIFFYYHCGLRVRTGDFARIIGNYPPIWDMVLGTQSNSEINCGYGEESTFRTRRPQPHTSLLGSWVSVPLAEAGPISDIGGFRTPLRCYRLQHRLNPGLCRSLASVYNTMQVRVSSRVEELPLSSSPPARRQDEAEHCIPYHGPACLCVGTTGPPDHWTDRTVIPPSAYDREGPVLPE